jgi:hypothetical protein
LRPFKQGVRGHLSFILQGFLLSTEKCLVNVPARADAYDSD